MGTVMTRATCSSIAPSTLLATDQLPYPPRNGITLPTYNYAVHLMETQTVEILLFADASAAVDVDALAENEKIFGKIHVVYLTRKGRVSRLFGELLGLEMYQHGWRNANISEVEKRASIDTVIVSPISAVAKWRSSGLQESTRCHLSIAALNDCTTAEYYFRLQQGFGGIKAIVKSLVDRLRCRRIAKIEAQLLAKYHHVLLQTKTDLDLMARLVSPETASRVVTVPNGVREEYLGLEPSLENNKVVFVAELSGEYDVVARWLVTEVWPEVVKRDSVCQLVIVGKGASNLLKQAIQASPRTTHIEFVEDLCQLYSQAMIALSPVFKGFGLINKTLEAMASCVPVVGGTAAFNGIVGFSSGEHGIACRSRATTEFVDAISQLACDPARRAIIGKAGRALVEHQFRWEFSVSKIQSLIDNKVAC